MDKTRVFSLVNDASRLTGYAYNLYGYDEKLNATVGSSGSTQLTRVRHTPLNVAPGAENSENTHVIVISKTGPSGSPSHDDKAGIYRQDGAAHIIRDARGKHKDASGKKAHIVGGFNVYLKTASAFPDIRENFLVYADLSDVAEAVINEATSKIKGRYRLLVRSSSSKEATVTIRGNKIETGKIIQMEPSQRAAPRVQPYRKITTLVVTMEKYTADYMEKLIAYATDRYDTETETYEFHTCKAVIDMGDHAVKGYANIVFWFTGDPLELVPIYDVMRSISRQRAGDTISLVCTDNVTVTESTTMPVPYHLYRETNRTTGGGVTTIKVAMLRAWNSHSDGDQYKAIVVRPRKLATLTKDQMTMVVNMMVGKLLVKLGQPSELAVEAFDVGIIDGLKSAVRKANLKCWVLLLDEDDESLDVLDKINIHGHGSLLVLSGEHIERASRKDTRFSGWMRRFDGKYSKGGNIDAKLPVHNEILKGVHHDDMLNYARDMADANRPVVQVVVDGDGKFESHQAFVDKYDTSGNLRKLICGGETHAFVYNAATVGSIYVHELKKSDVLVIAAAASPPIDDASIARIAKFKCRVLINMEHADGNAAIIKQLTDPGNYKQITTHSGIVQQGGSKTSYVELAPTNNAFGMMSEFV